MARYTLSFDANCRLQYLGLPSLKLENFQSTKYELSQINPETFIEIVMKVKSVPFFISNTVIIRSRSFTEIHFKSSTLVARLTLIYT